MGDTDLLRELHDAYAWEVNAAVGEDRMDVVWRLVDEYTDRALQLMTVRESSGCGRPGCVICARSDSAFTVPARRSWHGWWARLHHAA
ncbi:MAG: hypothetical protein QOD98_4666 [Nocardioidaceae bacterium]|nr:hypothetical protein [Nocardioidaceae bacterium]